MREIDRTRETPSIKTNLRQRIVPNKFLPCLKQIALEMGRNGNQGLLSRSCETAILNITEEFICQIDSLQTKELDRERNVTSGLALCVSTHSMLSGIRSKWQPPSAGLNDSRITVWSGVWM